MIVGLCKLIDGLVMILTLGFGYTNVEMSYLLWRHDRDVRNHLRKKGPHATARQD